MKIKKIEHPFRISIYRGDFHCNCHSYAQRVDALKKVGDLVPDYFDKYQSNRLYKYRIVLSKFILTKKNGIKSKKLLEIKQP